MKHFLQLTTTLILLIFLGGNAWGQATLPVNAPSLDPIPTGFTNSGTGTYSGGSRKFDTQGDWFQLYFNSAPGELTFELGVNNSFPGTIPSTATFSVDESLDGNTWNNVGSYSNVPGGVKTINTLNSTSRYIRWIYSIKPSGTNIALKNVTLAAGITGPANPNSFTASASSTSQIDLSFATNVAGDNIVIVWNSDGIFSDPTETPPALGVPFAGGTLIYNGIGTTYDHTSLDANTQYYYKAWSYDNTDYSIGLTANATTFPTPPTIVLSDNGTQIATADVNQGTTDHILHKFQMAVTVANASLTGMTCTTAGSYVSGDITNLKVRYSADATLDGGDATLSTLATPGAAGGKTFTPFTSQSIVAGNTVYIFITADIAATATHDKTISLNAIATTDLTFTLGAPTGTTTAGGLQTIKDVTGPTVSVYNPLDDATEIEVSSSLILTFDENIQKGTGNITINKISDNSTVQTIDVNSGAVSILDATLTIDPPSELTIGNRYYINIAATAIEDMQGNAYAGISDNETWNFTTVAPSVTNVTSTNDDGTYAIGDEITVTVSFTDNVTASVSPAPYILLDMIGSDRQASYSAGTGTSTLTFTYTIQSSDEATDLDYVATNSLYTNGGSITSSDGVNADRTLPEPGSGNSISGQKDIVVDGVRPTVTDYSPADDASNVSLDQNLILTFSETVQQGTSGNVVIWNDDETEFETIPFDDARITISDNTVTINPTGTFSYASDYYVKISNNVFTDVNGNSYTGITDETTWNFTTLNPPATTTLPYNETFDANLGDCYTYSVSGATKVWYWFNFSGDGVASINGFNSGDIEEDWLILPGMNLDNYSSEVLSFETYYQYGSDDANNYLKLMYSTDYPGVGVPSSSTWAELSFTHPSSATTWTGSGNVDLSSISGTSVWIAFKYHYESGSYRLWDIDNIAIQIETPEPSNHPSSFGAVANSATEITVSWTHEDGSQAATDYLILAKKLPGTYANVEDGIFVSDDTDWNNNNAAINVTRNAEATQSYQWTSLTAGTTYDFIIYPYNGSSSTVNYKTDSPPTVSATTFGNDTEVYAPTTQIAAKSISSLVDTPAEGESMNVFTITIEDLGSGDGQPTKVTNIRVKPYTTTNTADWTNTIQDVFVDYNSNYIYPTATITDDYIDLTFASDALNIEDGTSLDVTLYVYLKTSGIVDGHILSFMVDADDHGFTADASGSGFASSFLLGDFNSNDMTLTVDATELQFKEQPTNVETNTNISPAPTVAFTDANGNIDVDMETANVRMTATGATLAGSPVDVAIATNGLATFSSLQFSTSGTGVILKAIDSDDYLGTSAFVNSDAFDVTELPKLIISEVTDPVDYLGRFVELFNAGDTEIDFSSVTIYFDRQANGGNHSSTQLTGAISPNETYVIGNASNLISKYGVTADLDFGDVTGNGDDGYFLFFNGDETTGTLLDAYGVINENGDGKPWDYENSKAVRNSNITTPNATWTASEWTITAADVADCTPGSHNGNVSWKGETGNWNTAASWSNGAVPTSTDNVIVPNGALLSVDVTDAEVNNINVQNGGALTIDASQALSVSGTITIEDGGSFINNGTLDNGAKGDANAVMQRSIDGWTDNTPGFSNGWHIIGSPVATFNIDASDFDPGSMDDFYGWSETTYEWLNHKAGNPTQVEPGLGYLVAYETTATKEFTGTFNNADVTHTDLSYTPVEGNGWHLLGNPFQSALHWTNSGSTWDPNNIYAGAKILENRNYKDIMVDGTYQYIPANQGFFVQVTDVNNSINIPAAERVHNSTAFYKSQITNALELIATDGGINTVKTWIQIMDGATADFDSQYDMHFLGGMYQAPQLYSFVNSNERISTNRIPEVNESVTVQLGFKSYQNIEYKIMAEDIETFEDDIDIYLEDTQENIQINLRETPSYTFMATADELTDRFKVHILKSTGINEAQAIEGLNIYTYANILYLNSDRGRNAMVELYNVTGQKVYSENIALDGFTQINPNLKTGWYVVTVKTSSGMANQKVFIQ